MSSSFELAKAIGDVLLRTADTWIYNCDGGCFESVCTREAWKNGPFHVIYQPHKSMREYDDMFATVFIKRVDKKSILGKEMNESVNIVKMLVMKSFHDILGKSNNLWTHPIKDNFEHLVQVKDDFRIEKDAVRFTFEIRGAYDGCCGDRWEPHSLRAFVTSLGSFDEAIESALCAGKKFNLVDLDEEFKSKLKCPVVSPP